MRTTKELLIIIRDNLPDCFRGFPPSTGICGVPIKLLNGNIINDDEYHYILAYLEDTLPVVESDEDLYHVWTPGEIEPRIKWLNEQIDKL